MDDTRLSVSARGEAGGGSGGRQRPVPDGPAGPGPGPDEHVPGGGPDRGSGGPVSVDSGGGVCSPRGFRAAGVHCGIKHRSADLALVASGRAAAAAGVFTTNRVQAAPVRLARRAVSDGRARAVVVNSGNANACTGERGERDARSMAEETARALGCPPGDVLVASTGLIGVPLPTDDVRAGIRDAAARLGPDGGDAAARAILTTDRFTKTAAVRFQVDGRPVTVGAMAKGAGMVHPEMATTLCFVTSDAAVEAAALRRALKAAVDRSFNRITVDGETSTNDAVLALANGASDAPRLSGEGLRRFGRALSAVTRHLALEVVRDGEGATTVAEVAVRGAADEADARRAASRLCTSPLVKTALAGGEPNWGRVVAAIGASGVELEPSGLTVSFGDVSVVDGGARVEGAAVAATEAVRGDRVRITVDLGAGAASATMWTCDLTEEYVRINAGYAS